MGLGLQFLPATIAGILYAVRAHHLAGTTRAVPGWRRACFFGGLALIVVTLASIGSLADQLFWVHMVEHLLVGDIGTLLLVLGLTGPVLAPVLRIRAFDRLRVLAHPAVAFPLWAIDLYLWHLPLLHESAVRHGAVHALQHASFVVFGANMWMALLGPLPKPAWFGNLARLGYIIAVRLAGAVLGNVLVFGTHVFFPVYGAGERAHGVTPGGDQSAAGAVMMIEGSFVTLLLFGWLFLRAAREGEERQELLDLAAARGVELTEARASRAVAAGRGGELRERIEAGGG
ncbi:MAG: putative rane protein [Solirubrobacteraceae bacterium]|jgi:cytochrome c oxidase assembly factor CtaG|nr:putative rane protein [Solirubrobacteraceae bacterium]